MSALDRQSPVVGAIIAALLGDAGLATLIGRRVYDAPPARAVMPSVTIKLVGGADASSADTEAQTLVFDLDVWDRYEAGANLDRPRAVIPSDHRGGRGVHDIVSITLDELPKP